MNVETSGALTPQEQEMMELALEIACEAWLDERTAASGVGAFYVKNGQVVACSINMASRTTGDGPVAGPLLGPNGKRIGFNESLQKVEWIEDDEEDGAYWGSVLRRSDSELHDECVSLGDRVWWNGHQVRLERIKSGLGEAPPADIAVAAEAEAKRIEDKYGIENLGWDDFHWGLLSGMYYALRWALGVSLEDSLDPFFE